MRIFDLLSVRVLHFPTARPMQTCMSVCVCVYGGVCARSQMPRESGRLKHTWTQTYCSDQKALGKETHPFPICFLPPIQIFPFSTTTDIPAVQVKVAREDLCLWKEWKMKTQQGGSLGSEAVR